MSDPKPAKGSGDGRNRGLQVILAGIIGIALIGFFSGIGRRPVPTADQARPEAPVATESRELGTVPTYEQLPELRRGPNADWQSSLTAVVEPPDEALEEPAVVEPAESPSDEERRAALDERATRRAYEGAPPVIPHPTPELGSAVCTACHADGLRFGSVLSVPARSHMSLVSCTQCHVRAQRPEFPDPVLVENSFQPIEPPIRGNIAWTGAPPQIPHTTLMREECASCHGETGQAALQTPHPERVSCTQCHVGSADLDQRWASLPVSSVLPGSP